MRNADPNLYEAIPRPVIAIGNDYPPAFELAHHTHARAQLLYPAKGVVTVDTTHGAWVVPLERAVWIPAGVPHAVSMVGAVRTRSVLISDGYCPARAGHCEVLAVSPLLRALLMEAVDLEAEYAEQGRDGLVMKLLMAEIDRAPIIPLSVPFPQSPALRARCHAFVARPDAGETIDKWAENLHLNRRAFTRLFRRETGMSFAEWRQQACVLAALPRLALGEPVTMIALDLGYDSPAAFSTMFRRWLGAPPSRYRRDDA
ncbi:helix-turn-helix transcriptional regulator [Asticcacaulis sp. EMRT-3]|uniref:AraC family transcriptional regulator n=1 Tax=Asticcacaulis sp. EMRT-3 TaxID=3040349 RepID=UPI0024AEB0F5|nr:helix-turn-helix transcriptional regulator [Asticcacaulis sp. EMRT-3]MDI7776670.1 helix-turn-helix transcriptional regulator [Asticcacaulis sp. EMRT-3]